MDVTVIVPTRNRSALLATTLRSVVAQRGVDFEVLVVDEASTDDTVQVVAGFQDPRIRVIRHASVCGVSAARNHGVAEARGAWIAFLDDDDVWAPEKLDLQLRAARERDAPWSYVGAVTFNVHYRVTGGAPPLPPHDLVKQLPYHNVVPGGCSGVMVAKQALERAGAFDLRFQPLADWDLWLRLADVGLPAWVRKPLVAYRLHGAQMSLDASRVKADFRILAERNPAADPAALFRYLGFWALRVKNHRAALRHFIQARLQRRPSSPPFSFAADLLTISGDFLEHRFRVRVPVRTTAGEMREEQASWRNEGQAWVDALMTRAPGEIKWAGAATPGRSTDTERRPISRRE